MLKSTRTESTLPDIAAEDIPALRALMNTVRRNPLPALKDLSTGKPPKNLLLAIVNLCLLESRVRRLGSAKVFIQYIIDGFEDENITEIQTSIVPGESNITRPESEPKSTTTPELIPEEGMLSNPPPNSVSTSRPRSWETPLRGIINILAGIKREKSPSRLDTKVIDELRAAYKPIMATIWRDSDYILLPGYSGDLRRSLIARVICLFASLEGMKQNMHDQNSLSLVMHCWLYMSSDFEYRQCALFAAQALFQNPRDASPGLKELAVETVTVEVLHDRFVGILQQGKLIDRALEEELWTFFQFAVTDHPFSLTFSNKEVYNDISSALQHQLHYGAEQWMSDIFNIAHHIIYHMLAITPASTKMFRFTHMIQSSLLNVAAAGLIIANRKDTEDWFAFLNRITHTLDCTSSDCPYRDTPEFRAATRASFEPLYLPFRVVLRGTDRTGNPQALTIWEELATLLGVTEENIREKRRKERQCGDVCCQNTGEGVKTLACIRCRAIYYCSKACQKRDWKDHKPLCVKEMSSTIGENGVAL